MPCVGFHRHVWFPHLDSCYPIPCVVPIVSPWNPHQHPTKSPWNCHKKSMTWTELHLVAKIREALLSQTRLCRAPRGVVSDKGNNWEPGWSLCIYCNIWILHKYIYIYIYQYIYTHTSNYMCYIAHICYLPFELLASALQLAQPMLSGMMVVAPKIPLPNARTSCCDLLVALRTTYHICIYIYVYVNQMYLYICVV